MDFTGYKIERLLPILINKTAIFLFLMCILTIFLYVAGTSQGFIDSTQLFLLRLYVIMGIFLMTASVFGMFLELSRVIKRKSPRYFLRAGGYLLLLVFATITVMASLFVIALSEGNMAT